MTISWPFLITLAAAAASADYNITVSSWCDNSIRVRVAPAALSSSNQAAQRELHRVLEKQGLAEVPSALLKGCNKFPPEVHGNINLSPGEKVTHGNLGVFHAFNGSIIFTTVDSGAVLFSALPALGPTPVPSAVEYDAHGATVPCGAKSDWILINGTDIVGSREGGAQDLRSGEPHTTGVALNAHPIDGNGHLLASVSLSFRYAAGYTPGPGKTVEASTARAVLVDALDSTVIAKLWESGPLDNVSYDHFSGYSAPVTAQLTGLRVAHGRSLRIALLFDNHDRNLNIPISSISINLTWSDEIQPTPFAPSDMSDGFIAANLTIKAGDPHERIYGLGQGEWTAEGGCPSGEQRVVPLLRNGQSLLLQQRKFHVAIPFVYSSARYGFLFNMPGYGSVAVGALGTGGMEWKAEATAHGLDFWVSAAPSASEAGSSASSSSSAPSASEGGSEAASKAKAKAAAMAAPSTATTVVEGADGRQPSSTLMPATSPSTVAEAIYEQYADATGHSPPLRENAMLFWQSRNRYKSSQIAMSIADKYAALDLPVGVLVIDYKNQINDGDFKPDPSCFPSVANLSAYVAKTLRGASTVFSFWPEVLQGAAEESTLDAAGCLINSDLGGRAIDTTPASCRELIWRQFLKPRYYDQGVTAYWLDETDGEGTGIGDGDHGYDTSYGPARVYSQLWVNSWLQTFGEPVALLGHEPPLLLTRGVWAGGQRHGVVLWSSDIWSSFEQLASQVPQGIHASLSGIPWWTTDVGGYGCGMAPPLESPYMRELIVRWYEFGLFCPVFRTHGCRDGPSEPDEGTCHPAQGSCGFNEVWSYGDQVQLLLEKFVRVRKDILVDYIKELDANVTARGVPTMRPLWWEFNDPAVADVNDQYLLGPRLLVAPVTVQNATSRVVLFPKGATWTSFWDSSKQVEGGQTLTVDAPLGTPAVYWRT